MAFVNSEQYISLSGVGLSGGGASVYKAAIGDSNKIAVAQSGSQAIVGSGAGTLIAVIGLAGLLSGGGGSAASQSGCTITIIDAISGATVNYQSGASLFAANTNGVLYQFHFGAQSGAVGAGTPPVPATQTQINAVFRSGLQCVVSGGVVGTVGVSIVFNRAL